MSLSENSYLSVKNTLYNLYITFIHHKEHFEEWKRSMDVKGSSFISVWKH